VRRAHGIRGELVVEPLTGEPLVTFAAGRRVVAGTARGAVWRDEDTGATRELVVTGCRPFKGGLLVMFDAISDRTEAERWRDRHLLVPEDELSAPGEGEVYLRELEGMRVLDGNGAEVGVVSAWYEAPSGILLDVKNGQREATVPFNAHFVRNVNRSARTLAATIPDELWHGGGTPS
jgi:16S rRNA processing protein RimM